MKMIDIAISVNGQVKETNICKKCHSPQPFHFALIMYGKSNLNKIVIISFRKNNAEITKCSLSIHHR